MTRDLKMYILVNEDIDMTPGKLAGQVGHAVASYIHNAGELERFMVIDEYMKGIQKKIILKCPQNQLEMLEQEGNVSIRDKGLTHLEPNTLTCVNLGVLDINGSHPYLDFVKGLKLL